MAHLGELFHRQGLGLGLEVQGLAADHPTGPRRAEQLEGNLAPSLLRQPQGVESVREHPSRQGDHLIAGASRAGDIEGPVRRRPAAPQIVVVHAGEVVVDERVGVHDLDGRRELRHAFPARPAQGFVRGEDEGRPQALALAEQAVADDGVAAFGPDLEHGIHAGAGVGEVGSEPTARGLSLHP